LAPGGELVAAELPDGSVIELSRAGLALKIANPKVETEVEKDVSGQVIADRQGEHQNFVEWSAGQVRAIKSDIGPDLEYERRFDGRVDALNCGPARFVFHQTAPGGETLTYLGRFLALRRRFTAAGRLCYAGLSRISNGATAETLGTPNDPGIIANRVYRYDDGHTLIEEVRDYETTVEYELNPNKQITTRRTTRQGQVIELETIQYDAAGSPRLPDVGYDGLARPSSFRGETLRYDDCGNLAERSSS